MMKLLVPQQWYGISDMELERQTADRISFQRLLGWPEQLPDYSTVWQLRERLASTRTDKLLWAELQRQLDAKGLRVRKGVAQDASFIARARQVERTFAVIKRVFNGGRVLVTSLPRVRVKLVFSCFCFNLLKLGSLGCVP